MTREEPARPSGGQAREIAPRTCDPGRDATFNGVGLERCEHDGRERRRLLIRRTPAGSTREGTGETLRENARDSGEGGCWRASTQYEGRVLSDRSLAALRDALQLRDAIGAEIRGGVCLRPVDAFGARGGDRWRSGDLWRCE